MQQHGIIETLSIPRLSSCLWEANARGSCLSTRPTAISWLAFRCAALAIRSMSLLPLPLFSMKLSINDGNKGEDETIAINEKGIGKYVFCKGEGSESVSNRAR